MSVPFRGAGVRAAPCGALSMTRREFLAFGLGPFPFFWRRRQIRLAGAKFRIVKNGRSPHRYLMIHGNEQTAREVLEQHIRANTGTAFIIESSERNVQIRGGMIDPNRMFSRVGAEANLKRLNPKWAAADITGALEELDHGRAALVHNLFPPPGGRTVALHNNSEGYSVQDEVAISDRTSLKEPQNPHAFFLATDPADYAILAGSPYNAVLQQYPRGEDDGSLSRLAAARGVRYVNLEVALGDSKRQQEMLGWLESHLP